MLVKIRYGTSCSSHSHLEWLGRFPYQTLLINYSNLTNEYTLPTFVYEHAIMYVAVLIYIWTILYDEYCILQLVLGKQ